MAGMSKRPSDDDVFIADPDDLEIDVDAVRPGWPKAVGIISIVWGVVGVVCNGLGIASFFLTPMFMGQIPGGAPDVLMNPAPLTLAPSVLGALASVFLIVAGAALAGRQPAARAMHLAYGAASIVLIGLSIWMQLGIQARIAEWCRQNSDTDFARQQAQGGSIGQVIGLFFAVVFLVWPIFCLIWFGVIKKRPGDMTGGVAAPAA